MLDLWTLKHLKAQCYEFGGGMYKPQPQANAAASGENPQSQSNSQPQNPSTSFFWALAEDTEDSEKKIQESRISQLLV
eukprot:3451400-Amphidinium_carterae.2